MTNNQTSLPEPHRAHLVITLHGIRTFGQWQERLERLLIESEPAVSVRHFKYGYFSLVAFLIPPLRWIVVRRFRRQLLRVCGERQWTRIDLVAHSFGTHIAVWALRRCPATVRPRVHTIILAGSVLKADFDWNALLGGSVSRVVNDCGIDDTVLVLSQVFVLFTGMAGRVGFSGLLGPELRNRFHRLGHSGYFAAAREDAHSFMEEFWLPLLTEDAAVQDADERTSSAVGGFTTFVLNNLEPLKVMVYVGPILIALIWVTSLYRTSVLNESAARLGLARSLAVQADAATLSNDFTSAQALLVRASRVADDPEISSYSSGVSLLKQSETSAAAAAAFGTMIEARLRWLEPVIVGSHPAEAVGLQRFVDSTVTLWLRVSDFKMPDDYRRLLRIRKLAQPTAEVHTTEARTVRASELARAAYFGSTNLTGTGEVIESVAEPGPASFAIGNNEYQRGAVQRNTVPSLADIQSALQPNEALVDIVRANDRYVAFVVGPKTFSPMIEIGSGEQLNEAVKGRDDKKASGANRGLAFDAFRLGGKWGREEIYDLVWSKIRSRLPEQAAVLYMVAEGTAALIPFEALKPRDGRWLIERYTFVYLVSPSDLLTGVARRTWNSPSTFTLVGDPDFDEKTAGPLGALRRLPGSGREVRQIAERVRAHGLSGVRVLTGRSATEAAVRSSVRSSSAVLHLSTHSWSQLDLAALAGAERTVAPRFQVLTNWSGLRAGVALTGDGPRAVSADDDGLLTAAEIAEMDIASELVVLSSCSSVGTLAAGSGLTGLAGAFLRGRVNDLVLTLFDVLDEPTADLMVLFYEELLADPTASVPLALRRAKLKFMMNDEYSDPKFWEAFVVFSRGHTKRV